MTITFVLPARSMHRPVGGFRVVYEYANRLVERGYHVNVIHPILNKFDDANVINKMFMLSRLLAGSYLGIPRLSWFDISPKVNMIVVPNLNERHIPPADVIFATAWQTVNWIDRYAPTKGIKFYLIQDFYPWLGPKEKIVATWLRPFKKVTISHWLCEKVILAGGTNITVIPNGIDHETFQLTADFSTRPDRVTMLFSSVNYKAANDGLRALEICKKEYPSLQVTLFGVESPFMKIPEWITYKKNIKVKALVELYNQSRIYLCSSLAEGFAFPPAEAMACGCAVVSTNCGGISEYAENEVNALLSPPGDPNALAQNLLKALCDRAFCLKLAKNGNQIIKEFTWEAKVSKLEKVLLSKEVNEIKNSCS